ncbi:TIGR00341 family protein [Halobaculum lipolyticum]|uniref:TIGR00341 family protein n=1 Tax=Halobaculum lipolyticum TaxID=3032001 RepID=A0ABD5WG22_9EURY|nr:TIGR00341 family protein [Halobaculum sp. DT31]
MRLVQVLIPEGDSEAVLATLDDQGVDFVVFPEIGRGGFEAMVQFPIPPGGVESVIESLVDAGIDEDAYTIVLAAETVVSKNIADLRARFPGLRISREELHARAEDLAPANSTFFAFLILSTVIATTGLLLDSAATIIGAMVVAPLMGPAISASVGTVLDDREMARRGVRLQVAGLLAAIGVAAVLGELLHQTFLVPPRLELVAIPQIAERTSPNVLSLFLALGSGIAGAISIIRGSGSSLVGVAIAVALVPPAATAGLGLAFGDLVVAVAGTLLVVVNLLAINVSALVLLYLAGYRPLDRGSADTVRSSVRSRVAVIGVSILVVSVVLVGVSLATYEVRTFEEETRFTAERIFVENDFEGYDLLEVSVDYTPIDLVFGNEPQVEILLGVPDGTVQRAGVAQTFDDILTRRMGRDVVVRVGFIDEQVSDEEAAATVHHPTAPALGVVTGDFGPDRRWAFTRVSI